MGLERLTVNLTPRASAALKQAVSITRDSKTDTMNRAIQLYALLVAETKGGGEIIIRKKNKEEQKVIIT